MSYLNDLTILLNHNYYRRMFKLDNKLEVQEDERLKKEYDFLFKESVK